MPKILLVEDDDVNRDMIKRRLQKRGYEIVEAASAADAIALARREQPQLILMDIELRPRLGQEPGPNGLQATRQLKAAPETHAIPVIALTAHVLPEVVETSRQAGCDDFETKPIEFPRLLGKMEALLNRRAQP